MIKLNLLPKALKDLKKDLVDWSEIPVAQIVGITVIMLLSIQIFSLLFIARNTAVVKNYQNKWEKSASKRKELSIVKQQISEYNFKIRSLDDLTKNRIDWARVLNGLSDSTLANIWFSRLYYKAEKGSNVILEGFATGSSEQATGSIGRQIDTLKNNNNFFKYFEELKLDSMRGSSVEKKEVMNFQLTCRFKEEYTGNKIDPEIKEDTKRTKRG